MLIDIQVGTAYFKPGGATLSELIKVLRQEFASMGVPEEISCDGETNLIRSRLSIKFEASNCEALHFCEALQAYSHSHWHICKASH